MSLDLTQPWRSYKVASVDFETTSADSATCEPVELAIVIHGANGVVEAKQSWLLRTEQPIPDEAVTIHGITNEMIAGQPTLAEIAPDIHALVGDAIPLAFNQKFDREVMHRHLACEGVPLFDPAQAWIDPSVIAWSNDKGIPGSGRMKLTACCERRGIRVVGAHRAMADALMASELFYTLMTGSKPELTMAAVLNRCAEVQLERNAEWDRYQAQLRKEDRWTWRQYAQAALKGVSGRAVAVSDQGIDDVVEYANRMLEAEKKRWL